MNRRKFVALLASTGIVSPKLTHAQKGAAHRISAPGIPRGGFSIL